VAYELKGMTRSQNQAEQSFFFLLKVLYRVGQQMTAIKDRGFGRIAWLKVFSAWQLPVITLYGPTLVIRSIVAPGAAKRRQPDLRPPEIRKN